MSGPLKLPERREKDDTHDLPRLLGAVIETWAMLLLLDGRKACSAIGAVLTRRYRAFAAEEPLLQRGVLHFLREVGVLLGAWVVFTVIANPLDRWRATRR